MKIKFEVEFEFDDSEEMSHSRVSLLMDDIHNSALASRAIIGLNGLVRSCYTTNDGRKIMGRCSANFDRPNLEAVRTVMLSNSGRWYCGGCGQTDKNKQCLGCRTP